MTAPAASTRGRGRSPHGSALGLLVAIAVVGCGECARYEPLATDDAALPPPPPGLDELDEVDHAPWNRLLGDAVTLDDAGFALVDYALIASRQDELDDYLALIARVDASALRDGAERAAFFLNAYNASVVNAVLTALADEPDFSPADDQFALFGREEHVVSGTRMSLDQLEHGVIRGDFERSTVASAEASARGRMRALHRDLWQGSSVDARIHMALNCAALGCPNLQGVAYLASGLEQQLERATVEFLANASKGAGPNGISSLFRPDWYEADFAADAGSVEAFIEAHREGGARGVALDRFLDYDWTLNRAPPTR